MYLAKSLYIAKWYLANFDFCNSIEFRPCKVFALLSAFSMASLAASLALCSSSHRKFHSFSLSWYPLRFLWSSMLAMLACSVADSNSTMSSSSFFLIRMASALDLLSASMLYCICSSCLE